MTNSHAPCVKPQQALASILFAVMLLGANSAPSPSPIPDDPQAEQIYHAARTAWGKGNYPRYATYLVRVSYTKNATHPIERHYDTYEDLRRNLVYARVFSHEEQDHPVTPHGTNASFGMNYQPGVVLNKAQDQDPLGSFAVGINNDFGVAIGGKPITAVQGAHEAAQSTEDIIIGRTATTEHVYALRLIEAISDADGRTYHLGLTPLRNPERNRLRELWVDANTSLVKRILVSANFNRAPFNKTAWLIEYHIAGGAPYIAREIAQGPLDFGKAGTATNVTISFEDIKPLAQIPLSLAIGVGSPPNVTDAP